MQAHERAPRRNFTNTIYHLEPNIKETSGRSARPACDPLACQAAGGDHPAWRTPISARPASSSRSVRCTCIYSRAATTTSSPSICRRNSAPDPAVLDARVFPSRPAIYTRCAMRSRWKQRMAERRSARAVSRVAVHGCRMPSSPSPGSGSIFRTPQHIARRSVAGSAAV